MTTSFQQEQALLAALSLSPMFGGGSSAAMPLLTTTPASCYLPYYPFPTPVANFTSNNLSSGGVGNKKKPQQTTTSRTNLYIAGLAENVTDDVVRRMVLGVIEPKSCKALMTQCGKCTGTGFIDCLNVEDAEKAKIFLERYYCSGAGTVDESKGKFSATTGGADVSFHNTTPSGDAEDDEESFLISQRPLLSEILRDGRKLEVKYAFENEKDACNVHVRNLPKVDFDANQLKDLFAPFGEVVSVKLLEAQNGAGYTGAGFVRYTCAEFADNAIERMNAADLILKDCDQPVRCKLADKTVDKRHKPYYQNHQQNGSVDSHSTLHSHGTGGQSQNGTSSPSGQTNNSSNNAHNNSNSRHQTPRNGNSLTTMANPSAHLNALPSTTGHLQHQQQQQTLAALALLGMQQAAVIQQQQQLQAAAAAWSQQTPLLNGAGVSGKYGQNSAASNNSNNSTANSTTQGKHGVGSNGNGMPQQMAFMGTAAAAASSQAQAYLNQANGGQQRSASTVLSAPQHLPASVNNPGLSLNTAAFPMSLGMVPTRPVLDVDTAAYLTMLNQWQNLSLQCVAAAAASTVAAPPTQSVLTPAGVTSNPTTPPAGMFYPYFYGATPLLSTDGSSRNGMDESNVSIGSAHQASYPLFTTGSLMGADASGNGTGAATAAAAALPFYYMTPMSGHGSPYPTSTPMMPSTPSTGHKATAAPTASV